MELLDIETIDYNKNELTAVFDGLFKEGFIIKANFEYDKDQTEHEDFDLGLRDYFQAVNVSFFCVEIYHDDNKISINPRELKKALQQISNKLEHKLEIYLNEI